MNHLPLKLLGQQFSFVDDHARWRTGSGLKQVGYTAGVVEVPVAFRDFGFEVGSVRLPARAGQLVGVTVVTSLHDVVDPNAFVPVVVVVRLPHGAVRVDGHFVVVAKVLTQQFHVLTVGVAAEHHSLLKILLVDGLAGDHVDHGFTVLV